MEHMTLLSVGETVPCTKVERSALAKMDRIAVRCVGLSVCPHRTGTMWGSGPFTTDSPICLCAVFAGLIDAAAGGSFVATSLGVLTEYKGGRSNEIESRDWTKTWNGMQLTG
jgi:hypothetical protein